MLKTIKEHLTYDPLTGNFYNAKDRANQKAGTIAGNVGPLGYRTITVNYKFFYAHHLAVLFMTESLPEKGSHVDHINGKKDDNRWENLRIVPPFLNGHNRKNLNKNNTSGFPGVWQTKSGKFCSRVTHRRKQINFGTFDTVEEAIYARKAYRCGHGLD